MLYACLSRPSITNSLCTCSAQLWIRSHSTLKHHKPAPQKNQSSKLKHEAKKNINNKDSHPKPKDQANHNNQQKKQLRSEETGDRSEKKQTRKEEAGGAELGNERQSERTRNNKHGYVKGAPFSRRSTSTAKWITRQLRDPYHKTREHKEESE